MMARCASTLLPEAYLGVTNTLALLRPISVKSAYRAGAAQVMAVGLIRHMLEVTQSRRAGRRSICPNGTQHAGGGRPRLAASVRTGFDISGRLVRHNGNL
jgi:hypothetical protein